MQLQESTILPDSLYQPDGSISILKSGRQFRLIMPVCNTSTMDHLHLMAKGNIDSSIILPETLRTDKDQFEYKNKANDGSFWVQNTYLTKDGILAFVHIEQAEGSGKESVKGYSTGRSRIGLAWSVNGGEKFYFLGNIIIPYEDPNPHNIQGVPYIIKDGYFYIYFHDTSGNSVARAPVDEVVNSARKGITSVWKKYNGPDRGFSSDGLGGPSLPIGINAGITHTDASCSTYNNKCYLILTRMNWDGRDTWIKLYESEDGVKWSYIVTVAQEAATNVKHGYQYATIINEDGNDNGVVGAKFYIYSQRNHQDSTKAVYRWTIDLSE